MQAEHQIEEDLIVLLGKILDSLDHAKHELDLLVTVGLDGIGFECDLVLRELSDDRAEAGLGDSGKGVVIA